MVLTDTPPPPSISFAYQCSEPRSCAVGPLLEEENVPERHPEGIVCAIGLPDGFFMANFTGTDERRARRGLPIIVAVVGGGEG